MGLFKLPLVDNLLEAGRAALDYMTARLKSAGKRAADAFEKQAEKAEARADARRARAAARDKRMSEGGDGEPPTEP